MTALIIFEKPKQARTVCKVFGQGVQDKKTHLVIPHNEIIGTNAIAVWAIGHLVQLSQPDAYDKKYKEWKLEHLPIIPERFTYQVIKDKEAQFNIVKKWVHDPSIRTIIHAGDPGREGSLLVDELLILYSNKKPVKRLWSTSLAPAAVTKAFGNMKDNSHYIGHVRSGMARSYSDWIIGLNLTRLMSISIMDSLEEEHKRTFKNSLFPVGRVQSALLSIIYQRQLEIEQFQSIPFWDVSIEYEVDGELLKAKWYRKSKTKKDEHFYIKEQTQVMADYFRGKPVTIEAVKREKKLVRPPRFYNLDAIQMKANRLYGFAPSEVLNILQQLYLKSLISYPRSSPKVVTKEEEKSFPLILQQLRQLNEYKDHLPAPRTDISDDKRYVDDAGVDDHYALILTEEKPNLAELTANERKLYHLIAESMILAHYPDAVYEEMEVIASIEKRFLFVTKGRRLIEPGWKLLSQEEDEENNDAVTLPSVKEKQTGTTSKSLLTEGKTHPPALFTLGSLIGVMENAASHVPKKEKERLKSDQLSLGTVATRATVIENLVDRDLITTIKNKVYVTPKGNILMRALGTSAFVCSPLATGQMEKTLDDIGEGKADIKDLMKSVKEDTAQLIERITNERETWDFSGELEDEVKNKQIGSCPLCQKDVIDKGKFYGCSGYSSNGCDFTLPKTYLTKTITVKQVQNILDKGQTTLLKGFKRPNSELKPVDGYLQYDKEKKKLRLMKQHNLK